MKHYLNCLSYWFPKLQATGVPVPKTFIATTPCHIAMMFEGERPKGFDELLVLLKYAVNKMGLPCFLRSGQTSAKHSWKDSCYITSADDIEKHVLEIVEYGEMASLLGLPYNVWAVRELLPTKRAFTAFHDMPVTKERRYFIKGGKVLCHHPYWPLEAFENHVEPGTGWEKVLDLINTESPEEIAELTALSEKVSLAFDGAWSLDWLHTDRGWYAIDMASMDQSYHWPGCPNAPTDEDKFERAKREAKSDMEFINAHLVPKNSC